MWNCPVPQAVSVRLKKYPSVFHHLKSSKLFNAFRRGDVTLEDWYSPQRLDRIMKETLGFLYF